MFSYISLGFAKDAKLPPKATQSSPNWVNPCLTYSLMLHAEVCKYQPTKDAKVSLEDRPGPKEQKIYKRQAGQRKKILCFLFDFVSLCVSIHFFSRLSLWDKQFLGANHYPEKYFSGHQSSLTLIYSDESRFTFFIQAGAHFFVRDHSWQVCSKEIFIYPSGPSVDLN